MSFAEALSEDEHFMPEQRRGLLRRVSDLDAAPSKGTFRAERKNGRLRLVGPRTITQAEVEAILEDFP
jgi:hypothetical protein